MIRYVMLFIFAFAGHMLAMPKRELFRTFQVSAALFNCTKHALQQTKKVSSWHHHQIYDTIFFSFKTIPLGKNARKKIDRKFIRNTFKLEMEFQRNNFYCSESDPKKIIMNGNWKKSKHQEIAEYFTHAENELKRITMSLKIPFETSN